MITIHAQIITNTARSTIIILLSDHAYVSAVQFLTFAVEFLMPRVWNTAAASASKVEAVIRSPTNMAVADIAAANVNKMTSLDRPAAGGHVRWGRSASQSSASNACDWT